MSRKDTDFAGRNRELFAQRTRVITELAELDGSATAERRKLNHQLERINHELVELNSGLVGEYCKSFQAHSPNLADDLHSAGYVGLVAAINNYDAEKGASFSHWAYRWIQREVLTEVRKHDHSTISQSDFERRRAILNARDALEMEGNTTIDEVEVARRAGVSLPQAKRVLAPTKLLSLDRPADGDDGSSAAELVESIPHKAASVEDTVMSLMDSTALAAITLEELTPRERFVLVRRFGMDGEPPLTLAAVGKLLDRSRESVRMIQSQALEKLSSKRVRSRLLAEVSMAQELATAS